MLRFYFVIAICFPLIVYYITKAHYLFRHPDKYDELYCYKVARNMIRHVMHAGRIKTTYKGIDNLPKEGGYILFSNHQGKYDALGILNALDEPCSIVIDKKTAAGILTNEFVGLLNGIRLDKEDMRQQMKSIRILADEVKKGRKFILFPEGGYTHNHNELQKFMPGAFKAALWSKCPIIPVALIDSYKPFEVNTLRKVTTQVHFLKPISYEDYKDMSTVEIADMVSHYIKDTIAKNRGHRVDHA